MSETLRHPAMRYAAFLAALVSIGGRCGATTILYATAAADGAHPNGRIELDYTAGTILKTFNGPAGVLIGDGFTGAAFRQATGELYISDGAGSNDIFRFDPATGAVNGFLDSPTGSSSVDGLEFVGDTLYALQLGGGSIAVIHPDTGALINTLPSSTGGIDSGGLTVVNGILFSRGALNTSIVARDLATGAMLNSFATPSNEAVLGLASDRIDLYAASGAGVIYRINPDNGQVHDSRTYGINFDSLAGIQISVPGDYNNNGFVDAADYVVWRKNEGTNNMLPNDGGLPGPIGLAHYNRWRANFGKIGGISTSATSIVTGSGGAAGVVPEPNTFAIAVTLAGATLIAFMSSHPKRRLAFSALVMILIIDFKVADASFGQETFWVADGVGNWLVPGNWSAGVPKSLTIVQINNGGTARLFDPGARADAVRMGVGSGNSGTFEILGGEATIGGIYPGISGTGTLRVQNSGSLTTRFGYIASLSGSTGTASIDGPGSKWNFDNSEFTSPLYVGFEGMGMLTIVNGGQVNSVDAYVGYVEGSDGTATVDGAQSLWTFGSGVLHIGTWGVGSVTLSAGGEIRSPSEIVIGRWAGGNGTLTVTGGGSNAFTPGALRVGHEGVGTLRIENGGGVTVWGDAFLGGNAATANGTAIVTGAGSELPSSLNITPGNLNVGGLGRGSLTIENGGHVFVAGNTTIASRSTGTISVSGAGSTWANSGSVNIDGFGSATVMAGGHASSTGVLLSSTSSNNVIVVDGPGSKWTNSGLFFISVGFVGDGGAGSLTVSNGGVVSSTGGIGIGRLGTVKGDGTIVGNVDNGGAVAPGTSPGALHISGNYTQGAVGKLQIELASTASFDRLHVTGNMSLDGTLEVSLTGGYVPSGNRSFDILDWTGSRSGTFSSIQLPTLGGMLSWDTSQLYTTGLLSVMGTELPGDFNLDGSVDAADYVVWRKSIGTIYTPDDFNTWRAHFGQTSGSGSAAQSASVPEPSAAMMCVICSILIRRRRHR